MTAQTLDTEAAAAAVVPTAGSAAGLPAGLFRYITATSWMHQLALLALTVAVFLAEVVPLEIQRRVVNDVIKGRPYGAIVTLCAAYVATVAAQGAVKLALNVYRAWVGERAKRDLRRRIGLAQSRPAAAAPGNAEAEGTAISMMVAEVEPVGSFAGISVSEPLLQGGIVTTVIAYVMHVDPWMGVAALALLAPQLIFVPLMQHAMNRRTRVRVWMLRKIGAGMIVRAPGDERRSAAAASLIDTVLRLNMRIFQLKFSMNFLMNLCTHLQVAAALLLGAWWVLQQQLEVGAIVAFVSAIGRLTDPWGDLVNYFRELSSTQVKFRLLAGLEPAAEVQ